MLPSPTEPEAVTFWPAWFLAPDFANKQWTCWRLPPKVLACLSSWTPSELARKQAQSQSQQLNFINFPLAVPAFAHCKSKSFIEFPESSVASLRPTFKALATPRDTSDPNFSSQKASHRAGRPFAQFCACKLHAVGTHYVSLYVTTCIYMQLYVTILLFNHTESIKKHQTTRHPYRTPLHSTSALYKSFAVLTKAAADGWFVCTSSPSNLTRKGWSKQLLRIYNH